MFFMVELSRTMQCEIIQNGLKQIIGYNMSVELHDIGRRIRHAVSEAKRRQVYNSRAELLTELDISDKTLRQWEQGKTRSLDIKALIRLFELAHLSMDEAFLSGGRESHNGDVKLYKQVIRELLDKLNSAPAPAGGLNSEQLKADHDTQAARREAELAADDVLKKAEDKQQPKPKSGRHHRRSG